MIALIFQPIGFMDTPVSYSVVEDINIVSRWDAGHKFCIRITIPDGSLLLQVSIHNLIKCCSNNFVVIAYNHKTAFKSPQFAALQQSNCLYFESISYYTFCCIEYILVNLLVFVCRHTICIYEINGCILCSGR